MDIYVRFLYVFLDGESMCALVKTCKDVHTYGCCVAHDVLWRVMCNRDIPHFHRTMNSTKASSGMLYRRVYLSKAPIYYYIKRKRYYSDLHIMDPSIVPKRPLACVDALEVECGARRLAREITKHKREITSRVFTAKKQMWLVQEMIYALEKIVVLWQEYERSKNRHTERASKKERARLKRTRKFVNLIRRLEYFEGSAMRVTAKTRSILFKTKFGHFETVGRALLHRMGLFIPEDFGDKKKDVEGDDKSEPFSVKLSIARGIHKAAELTFVSKLLERDAALSAQLLAAREGVETSRERTHKEIHRHFRRLALRFHPDRALAMGTTDGERDHESTLREWNKAERALAVLGNPDLRLKYDSQSHGSYIEEEDRKNEGLKAMREKRERLRIMGALPPQPPKMQLDIHRQRSSRFAIFVTLNIKANMREARVEWFEVEWWLTAFADDGTLKYSSECKKVKVGRSGESSRSFHVNLGKLDRNDQRFVVSFRYAGINSFGRGPYSLTQHVTIESSTQQKKDAAQAREAARMEKKRPLKSSMRKEKRWEQRIEEHLAAARKCVEYFLEDRDDAEGLQEEHSDEKKERDETSTTPLTHAKETEGVEEEEAAEEEDDDDDDDDIEVALEFAYRLKHLKRATKNYMTARMRANALRQKHSDEVATPEVSSQTADDAMAFLKKYDKVAQLVLERSAGEECDVACDVVEFFRLPPGPGGSSG